MFLKEILSENEPKFIKGDLLKSIIRALNKPLLSSDFSKVPFVIGFNPIENCDTILLYQDDEIMGFIRYNPDANIGEIRANQAVGKIPHEFLYLGLDYARVQSYFKFNLMLRHLGFCFEKKLVNHLDVPILMRLESHGQHMYTVCFNLCIRKNRKCFCKDFRCWHDFDYREYTHMRTLTAELLEEIRSYGPLRTCSVPILRPYFNSGSGTELRGITPETIVRWFEHGKIPEDEFDKLTTNLASLSLGMNQVYVCQHGRYQKRIDDELNLHNIDEAINEYIQKHSNSLHSDKIDHIVHVTYNLCGLRLKSYKVYG